MIAFLVTHHATLVLSEAEGTNHSSMQQ